MNSAIIVSTQGSDVASFQLVARKLKATVYGGSALIVFTTVTPHDGQLLVTFHTDKAGTKPFSFSDASGLRTVITISHGGAGDGPNLGFGVGDPAFPSGYQPWGRDQGKIGTEEECLSYEANLFWSTVGRSLRAGGKIILLGCLMGSQWYATSVAGASNRVVYAAVGFLGAGDPEVAVPWVKAIESGKVPSGAKAVKLDTFHFD